MGTTRHRETDYCLTIPYDGHPADLAERVFDLVWRFDFAAPGFAVLDAGPGPDSRALRASMLDLWRRLGEVAARRGLGPFGLRSLSRFDQQVTTKFHLDGAPEQSLLMLGYEPSNVESRLRLADYARAAFDLGITPRQFLDDFNPMYRRGEDLLAGYVTEVPPPRRGHSRLVLVNNSSLPFADARTHPLGVMHQALIVTPNDAETRVVNSAMLVAGGADEVTPRQREDFLTTDGISPRAY